MTYGKSVRLLSAKDPTRHFSLRYQNVPLSKGQARLAGRTMLMPELDLKDYTCRAVLDVVTVTFTLSRPTQFRYVQRELEALVDRKPHVEPHLPDPGGVAAVFTATIQEPTLKLLRECRGVLASKFGEAQEPIVNELEVSVDFTPRIASDASRARMVAVLVRHLYPARDLYGRISTRPRFSWGSTKRQNSFTLKRSQIKLDDGDVLLNTAGDAVPPVDATYYLGHRKVGALWRVMDKVIDRQNHNSGTFVALSEHQKRARVEVRLDQLELRRLGVTALDDLMSLRLARLQGCYFKFMLPTFSAREGNKNMADRHWDRERATRFFNAGVVGLRAMDESRNEKRKNHRPDLLRHLRAHGIVSPTPDRNGRGAYGTFIAYGDLNDRVSMALRKLEERESIR
ncbi:hypothetical protein [Devosia riboflavina]